MAILTPGGRSRRQGYRGKKFYTRVEKGRIIAQAWPKKRGKPKQDHQRAQLELMSLASQAVKQENPRVTDTMGRGLKEYLSRNRGVRGTAAIRLRDWLTAGLFGRAFSFQRDDGSVVYTAAVVGDASDILDNLEPWPYSLLTRTDEEWLPTVACKENSVLCLYHSKFSTTACPPAQIPDKKHAAGGQ